LKGEPQPFTIHFEAFPEENRLKKWEDSADNLRLGRDPLKQQHSAVSLTQGASSLGLLCRRFKSCDQLKTDLEADADLMTKLAAGGEEPGEVSPQMIIYTRNSFISAVFLLLLLFALTSPHHDDHLNFRRRKRQIKTEALELKRVPIVPRSDLEAL
jgi:hypothetical protein